MKSAPVSAQDRILTIDMIRGFALFGIFLVNMPSFHSPMIQEIEETGLDFGLDLFFLLFVEGKFYTIFSFLFGLGFYLFMSRAEQKGLRTNQLFARRLSVLLLIGAAHFILLWSGDILHTYAIAGLILLLFYKRKTKAILIWAGSLLAVFHLILIAAFSMSNDTVKELAATYEQKKAQELPTYLDMYQHAEYLDWVAYRIDTEILILTLQLPLSIMPVLAMFLFGLCAGKLGVFYPNTPHLPLVNKVWHRSLLISIPLVVLLAALKLSWIDAGLYQDGAGELFKSLSGVALCFFYMSSLTLLLRKTSWQKRLRPLGYVGQMALTNYLSQTLICSFLFLVLDFWGKVSLAEGTLLCLVIYIFQIIFSYFWLRTFQFGPFEWIWRSLTYGSVQSMKKKKTNDAQKQIKTV